MAYSLKNVIKGSSIYTLGQIVISILNFFLIPVYTRYLTTEEYGIIGILEVFLSLLTSILMLGGYPAQTRYYYEYKEDPVKVGELLFSINAFLLIFVVSSCLLLTFFGKPIFDLFIKSSIITFNPFFVIIIWTVLFNIFSQLVIRFYIATKEYVFCATLFFFQFIISTSFILLFIIYFKEGALGKVKGLLFGYGIFCLIFYWPYARNFTLRFDFKYIKHSLAFGIPVVFHLACGTLLNSIDKVILEKYVSLSQIGIYTLGYQIGMIMSVLVTSINRAWTPNYYDLMKQDKTDQGYEIRRAFYIWLTVIGIICLIGSLFSREILVLLTPSNFHDSAKIIPIILFSYVLQGVYYFLVAPIFYFEKTKYLPFITGSSALLNIVLNILVIPHFGIMGAAYTTGISFLYIVLVVYFIGKRLFNPRFDIVKIIILLSILSIPCFGLGLQEISLIQIFNKLIILLTFFSISYAFFRRYLDPIICSVLSEINKKIKNK